MSLARDYVHSYLACQLQVNVTLQITCDLLKKDQLELQQLNTNEMVRSASTFGWMVNDFYLTSCLETFFDVVTIMVMLVILMTKSIIWLY